MLLSLVCLEFSHSFLRLIILIRRCFFPTKMNIINYFIIKIITYTHTHTSHDDDVLLMNKILCESEFETSGMLKYVSCIFTDKMLM